jgi:hypothetical protein
VSSASDDFPSPTTFLRWATDAHVRATLDGADVVLTADDGFVVPGWIRVHATRIKSALVEELRREERTRSGQRTPADISPVSIRRTNPNVRYGFDLR